MTFCCIWLATQIKKTSSSIKLELMICFVNLKGIILQHFAFCPPIHYIFKTLVSNGKHIYDERGNRSWNGMLFSSKKALVLNCYLAGKYCQVTCTYIALKMQEIDAL
jgi:hypothetical protein